MYFNFFLSFKLASIVFFRSKMFFAFFIFLFFCFFSGLLVYPFGARQAAVLVVDVSISISRIVVPVFLILLVQELFTKEFERRYYLSTLSYPVSRVSFVLSRFFFSYLVSVVLLLLVFSGFFSAIYLLGEGVFGGWLEYLTVFSFMALDLLVISAVAVSLAVVASSPVFVLLGSFGFILISRSYSSVVRLLSGELLVVDNGEAYRDGLGYLGVLFPDLGALDVRGILIYRSMRFLSEEWFSLIVSCLSYAVFFVFLSLLLFRKKRFD